MANVTLSNNGWYTSEDIFWQYPFGDFAGTTQAQVIGQTYRGQYIEFIGTDLAFDANGFPASGTINAINVYSDSSLSTKVASVTGLGADFGTFLNFGGLDTAFVGDDTFTVEAGVSGGNIQSRSGNDHIVINDGFSGSVYGGDGNDTIVSGSASYSYFYGDAGNDLIDARNADQSSAGINFQGGFGDDTIYGSAGSDVIDGGAGKDVIDAGAGTDFVSLREVEGPDTVEGGLGDDYLLLDRSSALTAFVMDFSNAASRRVLSDGTTISGFELVEFHGGAGNDRVVASSNQSGGNDVYGNGGNDTLSAGTAGAHLEGGDGNDVLNGGAGADFLIGGGGDDRINLGAKPDHYLNEFADGGSGRDTITSAGGYAMVRCGDGNDLIDFSSAGTNVEGQLIGYGDNGNDRLIGSNGKDQLYGDGGNDSSRPAAAMITLMAASARIHSTAGVAMMQFCLVSTRALIPSTAAAAPTS